MSDGFQANYTVKLMGFYGEVEINCRPNKGTDLGKMRTAMVDEAVRAYGELKKARVS